MAVGFGFSASDFVAGVLLLKDLIKALDSVSGSSAEFQALCVEFRSLERALELTSALASDSWAPAQREAIEHCIRICLSIIQAFLARATKFDVALGQPSGASQQGLSNVPPWKVALRKIQWAFLKKDDVIRVRLEISAQTAILNTLLNQTQLKFSRNHEDTLAQVRIQLSLQQDHLQQIAVLLQQQSHFAEQGHGELRACKQSLDFLQTEVSSARMTMTLVWRLGQMIFEMILGWQQYLVNPLPAQVLLQKVAILEDALGRNAPLHIEWLNSCEASCNQRFCVVVTKGHHRYSTVRWRHDSGTILGGPASSEWIILSSTKRPAKLSICRSHGTWYFSQAESSLCALSYHATHGLLHAEHVQGASARRTNALQLQWDYLGPRISVVSRSDTISGKFMFEQARYTLPLSCWRIQPMRPVLLPDAVFRLHG